MIYVLDTHALVWMLDGDKRLTKAATMVVKDTDNSLFVSIATLWEIAIKRSLNKLDFTLSFDQMYRDMAYLQIGLIPIEQAHLETLEVLPFHHGDPFDRTIIAQARVLGAKVISKDRVFPDYDVEVVW